MPDKITIRLTPEVRLAVGRFIAREQEKLEKAGSILSAPTAPDAVRALLERGLAAVKAEEDGEAFLTGFRKISERIGDFREMAQRAGVAPGVLPSPDPCFEKTRECDPASCPSVWDQSTNVKGIDAFCCLPRGHAGNHHDKSIATVWPNRERPIVSCGKEEAINSDGRWLTHICSRPDGHAGDHSDGSEVWHNECGAEVQQDDPANGQPETFTCRHKKGHPGNHEDAGLEWYDRPTGGTFTHRKAEGGEGGMP